MDNSIDYYKIYDVPPLPNEIKRAISEKRMAIFLGAGVSRLIGCVGWDILAKKLVERCFSEKKDDNLPCINEEEKKYLLREIEKKGQKKVISICYGILKEHGKLEVFFGEMELNLKAKEEKLTSRNIYDLVYDLKSLFITTNADVHFDDKFSEDRIVYRMSDFNPENIDRTKLYHIHGSIKDRESLVFTNRDYIKRYNDEDFSSFLQKIFSDYTILFMGYGLGEYELLDYVFIKSNYKTGSELKHFILKGYEKNQTNILSFDQLYYNQMGITVIAYSKDEKGYDQQYEVLSEWNREIIQTTHYLTNTLGEIEDAINDFNIEKAERIFQLVKDEKQMEDHFFYKLSTVTNPVSWIGLLKERGYLEAENNPDIIPATEDHYRIPRWNLLRYIEHLTIYNYEEPANVITGIIINFIESVISNLIRNPYTDETIMKLLMYQRYELLTDDHMRFIKNIIQSEPSIRNHSITLTRDILPFLLKNRKKQVLLRFLEIFFDYKEQTQKHTFEIYTSLIDEFWFNDFLNKHRSAIIDLCGLDSMNVALNKIDYLLDLDRSLFNYAQIPTIEDHPQSSFSNSYYQQLVYFVRDSLAIFLEDDMRSEAKNIISLFMENDHAIFNRIAIHFVDQLYSDFSSLFWNRSWKDNPLTILAIKHELFELFNNHYSDFSNKQLTQICEWIELIDFDFTDERMEIKYKEKIIARARKEWLLTIKDSNNPEVLSLYEKYESLFPNPIDHPGFHSWISDVKVGFTAISPVYDIDILTKSNEEIASYLKANSKQEGHQQHIFIQDVPAVLEKYVEDNPLKIVSNLTPFLSISRNNQYSILFGLLSACRKKNTFPWEELISFIEDIIEDKQLWNEINQNGEEFSVNYQIVDQIADLINCGLKSKECYIEPSLFSQVEEILMLLLDKVKSRDPKSMSDLVTSSLNSSKGKVLHAVVSYSSRYAKELNSAIEDRWSPNIKKAFEIRLDRNIDPSYEFSVILGLYLPHLYGLNKKWISNSINGIFLKENDHHWKITFSAYLSASSTVYHDIYQMLRKSGNYEKVLSSTLSDQDLHRVVSHISVAFLEGWEDLDDENSLISKLFDAESPTYMSSLISFFSIKRDVLEGKKRIIKELGSKIYEYLLSSLDNLDSIQKKKMMKQFLEWLGVFDEIDDDIYEWLIFSIENIEGEVPFAFVDNLLVHIDRTPEKAGKLFLEALNADVHPKFPRKENIEELVSKLFEKEESDLAERICNLYLSKGYHSIRDILEKYQTNS